MPLPEDTQDQDTESGTSTIDNILSLVKDPIGAYKRGAEAAGKGINQYLDDVKTASQPGWLDDMLGFFKENIQKTAEAGKETSALMSKAETGDEEALKEVAQRGLGLAGMVSPGAPGEAAKFRGGPIETVEAKGRPQPPIVSPAGELPSSKLLTGDIMALETAKAREMPAAERLAYQMQGGPLAEMVIKDKQAAMDLWKRAAQKADIPFPVDPPDPASFSPNPKVEFQARDQGIRDVFGTPASVAARAGNLDGYKMLSEINLTEAEIKKRIMARNVNDQKFLSQVGPETANSIAESMRGEKFDDAMAKMSPQQKQVATYIRQKFDTDRQLIQNRLRELVRPSVEREVRAGLANHPDFQPFDSEGQGVFNQMIEGKIQAKVDEAVKSRVPDSWGINEYLPEIFPGEYLVKNKAGQVLGSARTKFQTKSLIKQLIEDGKGDLSADDLKVDTKSFVDSDILRNYRKGGASFINELTQAAGLTRDEIASAAQGELGVSGHNKFWGNLMKRGKSPGFTKDIGLAMDVYNRGIERWISLTDLSNKVEPTLKELRAKGFPVMANTVEDNLKALWGYRSELSQRFDNELQRIPVVKNFVAPMALDRWAQMLKGAMVKTMIQFKPQFHVVNATQLVTTLAPIADTSEVMRGIKLFGTDEGKKILGSYGQAIAGKVDTKLGPIEDFNQGVSFLTMYDRAMRLGLEPRQAADYAFLRGNIYSQFHSLMTDRPILFNKLDPTGAFTIFQRFSVKQVEQLMDLAKDRHLAGAAKWLTSIGLMGGLRAITFGGGGYLGMQMYNKVKDTYGQTTADLIHYGLPSLVGIDLSNTAMAYNPPMGDSVAEKIGNIALGPVGMMSKSIATAALNDKAVDPSVSRRVLNTMIQRLPLAKELDAIRRIMMDDYDIKSPDGKLKYKADVKDLLKVAMGFRPLGQPMTKDQQATFSKADQLADWVTVMKTKRDDVLDYAASRYGQAIASGVGLPKDMQEAIQKEVEGWNSRWPEMPITGTDVMSRAKLRSAGAMKSFQDRLLKSTGKVGQAFQRKQSE